MDRAIRDSEQIGAETMAHINAAYASAVRPVLKRYAATLDKVEKHKEKGKRGLARSLFRSSGLLDALAEAIANAGAQASGLINRQHEGIMEVMADDDGAQTP